MGNTLTNITIGKGAWVNLYTSSGLTVGTAINIQNLGPTPVFLYAGPSAPTTLSAYRVLKPYEQAENLSEDTGAFCYSGGRDGIVNVSVA